MTPQKEGNAMKQRIALIFGGCSAEYEVSLQSACAVREHLNETKYEPILLGVTREGEWYQYNGPLKFLQNGSWEQTEFCTSAVLSPGRDIHGLLLAGKDGVEAISIDVAFPLIHGTNGEDGTLQGLLELAGIPYVGCGVLSSAVCMDKEIAHKLVNLVGINTPESVVICDNPIADSELLHRTEGLSYPLFVKPANAGSSFGISKVLNSRALSAAVSNAFCFDEKVIIEEGIAGFEVGCAILGNKTLTVGEVDEIELTSGFFDYCEKYTLATSQIHMPARIDPKTAVRIKETALTVYRALSCRGMARVDLFLTPENEIYFNEVNTIPGFTAHSRFPSMLRGIGMEFSEVLDRLIELAVEA